MMYYKEAHNIHQKDKGNINSDLIHIRLIVIKVGASRWLIYAKYLRWHMFFQYMI